MQAKWKILNRQTGETVVAELQIADSIVSRLTGLLFRKAPAPGYGILLVPCGSIHMFFMRFAIDLAYLDKKGTVLKTVLNLPPWRVSQGPWGSYAALETAAGSLTGLRAGDSLRIEPLSDTSVSLPRKLRSFA